MDQFVSHQPTPFDRLWAIGAMRERDVLIKGVGTGADGAGGGSGPGGIMNSHGRKITAEARLEITALGDRQRAPANGQCASCLRGVGNIAAGEVDLMFLLALGFLPVNRGFVAFLPRFLFASGALPADDIVRRFSSYDGLTAGRGWLRHAHDSIGDAIGFRLRGIVGIAEQWFALDLGRTEDIAHATTYQGAIGQAGDGKAVRVLWLSMRQNAHGTSSDCVTRTRPDPEGLRFGPARCR
jgi:hypothetical protein